jgi:hypothetical protein
MKKVLMALLIELILLVLFSCIIAFIAGPALLNLLHGVSEEARGERASIALLFLFVSILMWGCASQIDKENKE